MDRYFAYGSNCNPAVLEKKGIAFASRRRAVLPGYELRFNKKALRERLPGSIGFPNVQEKEGGTVEGVLYEIPEESLAILDETERCPDHYRRVRVSVETEEDVEECWTYQAQPGMVAEGLVPSRNYINHILAGHEFLSQQYRDALNRSETYRTTCAACHRENEVFFVKEGDRLHPLCQPCREARLVWSDAHGRALTLAETEAIMTRLVLNGPGFGSIGDLIREAVERKII